MDNSELFIIGLGLWSVFMMISMLGVFCWVCFAKG